MMNPNQIGTGRFSLNPFVAVALLAATFLIVTTAFAAESSQADINWLEMCKGLFGGLALFLFGMEQMSDALKSAMGNQMKELLSKLTRNRFTAVLTGTFVTAVVQSSSVTTVLVVGFVSAGMMSMAQSVGVIMGANIGTTVTAQIVAFKVEEAALWMVAIGFVMIFTAKQDRLKQYGNMLMGLGLIFFGMSVMGDAMNPLRSYPPFLELMVKMNNPLLAILAGAAFTALVQSSSATTAIVITMAGQGLISLEAGIALAFGANIGTCITALLASLGKPREAIRAAAVHVVFNVVGVLIWLPMISILAGWVVSVSPVHPELEGSARLAAEVPRQIANAHTVFNIANTVIFIFFTTQIANLVKRLVPDREEDEKVIIKPEFIDESLLETPAIALQNVRFEIARMGDLVSAMLTDLRKAILEGNRDNLMGVKDKDDQVDVLEGEILRYLAKLRKQELTDIEGQEVALAMQATEIFESVGDIIETDLVDMGYRVLEEKISVSETMRHLVGHLADKMEETLASTSKAVRELDQKAAQNVINMKADIDSSIAEALEVQSESMVSAEADIELIRMEMTLLDNLKRIHTYCKRIVRHVLPSNV